MKRLALAIALFAGALVAQTPPTSCFVSISSDTPANVGQTCTFTAVVQAGTPPLAYVWTKDGVTIAGATTNVYIRSNLVVGDTGTYSCTISNTAGWCVAYAHLTVVPVTP